MPLKPPERAAVLSGLWLGSKTVRMLGQVLLGVITASTLVSPWWSECLADSGKPSRMGTLACFWDQVFGNDRALMLDRVAKMKQMGADTYFLYGHDKKPIASGECHESIEKLQQQI